MSFADLIHGALVQGDAAHLDVAAATRLGRAFGTALRRRTGGGARVVVVARAGNGDELPMRDGLARGLVLCGHDVRDLGVADQRQFAAALARLGADGGALVLPAEGGERAVTFSLGVRPLVGEALAELALLADGEDFAAGAGTLTLLDVHGAHDAAQRSDAARGSG
ncbi:MAG: hypothetical protein HYS27_14030 [Deltaproteobacteria bacterium]|nr:hypothetical protein [Deltaproteobacteria bacterium]